MTTIAWDGNTLAADSQMHAGGYIEQMSVNKIFKLKDYFIAGAGSFSVLSNWAKQYTEGDVFEDDESSAFVVNKNSGKCIWVGTEELVMPKQTAIGSGSRFAIAAMLAGATAKEAVKIACKLDIHSGGRVREVSI